MHIAAMKPVALTSADVPADLIAKERSVAEGKADEANKELIAAGKPAQSAEITAKRIDGAVQKYLKEVSLADQVFSYFQKKRFPYDILIGERKLTLLGGPGSAVGKAASPKAAERACNNMTARLPTAEEYDHLSCLGEWNGGLDLCKKEWALAGGKVFADDLRNPSPVRSTSEVNASEYAFICVR
jgi:hypothetical protein